jgi:ribosomal protein L7Ae-like RNA K-turn-binding protein
LINNQKVLGLLGICTKAGDICSGTDICIELIKKHKIKLIIVAEDASERTKRKFEFLCKEEKIDIYFFGKIEQISKAIGKSNKAVIGIKNVNLSKEIIKIINGGEIIG